MKTYKYPDRFQDPEGMRRALEEITGTSKILKGSLSVMSLEERLTDVYEIAHHAVAIPVEQIHILDAANARIRKMEEALVAIYEKSSDNWAVAVAEGVMLPKTLYLSRGPGTKVPLGSGSAGHTCDAASNQYQYDLRCSGCVNMRIASEGPTLEVGVK